MLFIGIFLLVASILYLIYSFLLIIAKEQKQVVLKYVWLALTYIITFLINLFL